MKALVGSWDTRPHRVLAELTALRTRVAELQRELEVVRAENAALQAALDEQPSLPVEPVEVALTGR